MFKWICQYSFFIATLALVSERQVKFNSTMAEPNGVGCERGGGGGGGQDLHKCRSCGEACGNTTALYRHVAVRCLGQLGETMQEFKKKFQLQQQRARYKQRPEERRAQARAKVSQPPRLILGTFGQSSSILW